MRSFIPLIALLLGSRSFAQSTVVVDNATIVSGIDPSDIAAIPEPEDLGPPIGVADVVPTITFDAASVTASILALVTAATDVQTSILDSPATTSVAAQDRRKRAFVGGNTNLGRRDTKYPIDTSSYGAPNGYTSAFVNQQGATQGRGYLTYKTLKTYDPSQCTAACDKIKSCVFANIYYEKDPDASNNPVDVIKCSLYGMVQTIATATNKGQWRGSFQIQVTGSNGYSKATGPVAPTGYSLETLPNGINAPGSDRMGQVRYIQPVTLEYYSADLCAAACDQQTAYLKSQAKDDCNYKTCVYANLYTLSKNGKPWTNVCALYTQYTDPSAATNSGYTDKDDVYEVSKSIALTNIKFNDEGYPKSCSNSPFESV